MVTGSTGLKLASLDGTCDVPSGEVPTEVKKFFSDSEKYQSDKDILEYLREPCNYILQGGIEFINTFLETKGR